jgi:hypothetical protein
VILTAKRPKQAIRESDADLIKRIKARRQEVEAQTHAQHVLGDSPYTKV